MTPISLKKALSGVLALISKPPVHAQLVTANINKAQNYSVSVTAPSVSGYKFLCWAQVATVGWVGSVYPADPMSNPSNMWNASAGQTGTGRIDCLALYIPIN